MAIARKSGIQVHFWHVPDLLARATDLPVGVDAWFGEACRPTIENVVDHMRRVLKADLDDPILLSAEGHVFDGLHRLARCLLEGVETIRFCQFEADPEPFRVVDFDEFRREKPRIADTLVWMEEHKL